MTIEAGKDIASEMGMYPINEVEESVTSKSEDTGSADSVSEELIAKHKDLVMISKAVNRGRDSCKNFTTDPIPHLNILLKASEYAANKGLSSDYQVQDDDIAISFNVLHYDRGFDIKSRIIARDLLCQDSCKLSLDDRINILSHWLIDVYSAYNFDNEEVTSAAIRLSNLIQEESEVANDTRALFDCVKKLVNAFDSATLNFKTSQEFFGHLSSSLKLFEESDLVNKYLNYIKERYYQDFESSKIQEEEDSQEFDLTPPDVLKTESPKSKDLDKEPISCKSLQDVLKELSDDDTFRDELSNQYLAFEEFFEGRSKIYNPDSEEVREGKENIKITINKWEKEDIRCWAKEFRKQAAVWNEELKLYELDLEYLPELIAVLQQANYLCCNQILRIPQVLSLLLFFDNDGMNGMLQRVKTGEGKTTIVSCLIAAHCLLGNKVDFVTSSKVLAKRDVDERSEFLSMLGISSDHNCYEDNTIPGYIKVDGMYGTVSSFQFDLLRDAMGNTTRGTRPYQIVIVDEVDSMCIDESAKLALVSSPIPGVCYLWPLHAGLWFRLNMLKKQICKVKDDYYFVDGPFEVAEEERIILKPYVNLDEENIQQHFLEDRDRVTRIPDVNNFIQTNLEEFLDKVLPGLEIPSCLSAFILLQKSSWVESFIKFADYKKNVHYLLKKDHRGEKIAAPIDYTNTGVIQSNTTWGDGGHQTIQFKENIKLTPENIITSFISNTAFFQKYKKIYGVTGTLGSNDSINLLQELYKVAIAFMPTFKFGLFNEEVGQVIASNQEHIHQILSKIKHEAVKRAILVICQSIESAEMIHELLLNEPNLNNKLYCKADETDEDVLKTHVKVGDVIVATNIAGRGADIKTSAEVENGGGLFVLITFLPANLRVEEQAFGRTARQGNRGDGQIILNKQDLSLPLDQDKHIDIDCLKRLRDEVETDRLNEYKYFRGAIINLEDELFEKFCNLRNGLKVIHDSRAKLSQVEENFGIFLKKLKKTRDSVVELRSFKDDKGAQGYILRNHGSHLSSLYSAISDQIEYQLSSKELQEIVLNYLFQNETLDEYIPSLEDEKVLTILAKLLDCNVILLSDTETKQIGNIGSERSLLLGLFTDKFGRKFYHSVTNMREHLDIIRLQEYLKLDPSFEAKKDEIYDRLAKAKSLPINQAIGKFMEDEFIEFAMETMKQYKEGYTIVTNFFYLIVEANNTYKIGETQAINLLKMAGAKDMYYTYPAFHNVGYMKINNGALKCRNDNEIDQRPMTEAFTDLQQAKSQIENFVIPNIEAISHLSLSTISESSESQLFKQKKARVDALKVFVSYIDTVCSKIKACPEDRYIAISFCKPLPELLPDTEPLEIEELYSVGLPFVFDVKEKKLPTDVLSAIMLTVLGGIQIGLGILATCCGQVSLGANLFMSGASDFVNALKVFSGSQFNWNHYFQEKGVRVAMYMVLRGVEGVGQRIGLIAPSAAPEALTLSQALPRLGGEIMTQLTVDKALEFTQHKLLERTVKDLGEGFSESANDKIEAYFDNPDTRDKIHALLALDKVNGNQENAYAMQHLMRKAMLYKRSFLQDAMVNSVSQVTAGLDFKIQFMTGLIARTASAAEHISKIEERVEDLISLISNEINERYNARAATPDAYLNHMLKFNCSQDQIQNVIACLKGSGIIQNGEVVVANIPQSLEDHMGLPKELCKQSKLIKTKLLEYAKVISSDQQKAWSKDFAESLRDSLSSSAQKAITGAFDSEFANPMLEMCSKELIKNFRKQTSEFFEDVFKGKYKEKAEIAKIQKEYQNAIKQSQQVQNRSLIHTNEEPKTSPKTKQDVALKSKDDTDGYTSVPANDSPQISYPQSNPPQGSMSFPDQEALDAHRRSTGELNIRDSKGNPIDINALASMIDKNQNVAVSVFGQDPEQTSIVGYNKPQNNAPKVSQSDALNTAGNFGKVARALQFLLHQGGKAAAPTVVRGALAEAGALAAGGSEFAGAFIASQPEFWIPVGLVAAWYYRDDIASGFKSAYQAITSTNEATPIQPEFNSSGMVQEITQQEYAAERGNAIIARPEYRVAQGPSIKTMGISKPGITGPVAWIPTPTNWDEVQNSPAVRGQTTTDDTKSLVISTPAAARFANVANISTTFDPIPQEEPLPPLIPPHELPELNLFQQCPIRLEAREGMRADAKAAITPDMCPIFGSYSNQKLAQTLVDIACGIKFDPLFANVPKHIAGTFQHTHLKDVNEAYSTLCGDRRFKVEEHYSYGKYFDPIGKPRGSTKGMIRVDLRTTEPVGRNLDGNYIYEVYDLKTGELGITEKQLQNHEKNLSNDILYEVRPGGGMPVQIYPKI